MTAGFAVAVGACKAKPTPATPENTPAAAAHGVKPNVSGQAELGKPAPAFTLPDLDGKAVNLADYRGKVVVLEWFNPGCPFVKKSHSKGSLVSAAKRHTDQGVVWLAINSGAPGKQGHGLEANREARVAYSLSHPILIDETGIVGRAYGATNTPHMFVIDKQGNLVYRGAIDNSPDGEGESPKDGKLVNHVEVALGDLAAGRPIALAETEAYGCSVKYAN
jgi:peroxiredoxin